MPTSVYIIRHGAYDHRPSSQAKVEAASDAGLSALGRQQAVALRDRLAAGRDIRPDALFCSTLPRARQTADLIAPALGMRPQALPELCEWESGNEALGAKDFMRCWRELSPAQRRNHRFHPGCETLAEFNARVRSKLSELIATFENKTIVVVAHGGVVEAAFFYFLGFGPGDFAGGYPAAGNTSITLWQRPTAEAEWVQEYANDMNHLHRAA